MKDIQATMDAFAAVEQQARAQIQMTLGKMVIELLQMPGDRDLQDLGAPMSYRGYYEDIAFEPTQRRTTASTLAKRLQQDCLYSTFTGYKGGEYRMHEGTPMWSAEYGEAWASRILGYDDAGNLILVPFKV